MESQPQNPEFRIDPEKFHQCSCLLPGLHIYTVHFPALLV